jgi:hypothetical protein
METDLANSSTIAVSVVTSRELVRTMRLTIVCTALSTLGCKTTSTLTENALRIPLLVVEEACPVSDVVTLRQSHSQTLLRIE